MAKKDKKANNNVAENFELVQSAPLNNTEGERDYFAEYYNAYKNEYIDQYLKAYRELKDANAAIDKVDGTK